MSVSRYLSLINLITVFVVSLYDFYACKHPLLSFHEILYIQIKNLLGLRFITTQRMLDRVEIVDCDYESGKPRRNPDGLCVRLPLGKILSIMSCDHHQGRIKTLVNRGGGVRCITDRVFCLVFIVLSRRFLLLIFDF